MPTLAPGYRLIFLLVEKLFLLLLANRFVPLALGVHLPVSLQVVLFHLFLGPGTGAIAYLVLALNLALLYAYRGSFHDLLRARVAIG